MRLAARAVVRIDASDDAEETMAVSSRVRRLSAGGVICCKGSTAILIGITRSSNPLATSNKRRAERVSAVWIDARFAAICRAAGDGVSRDAAEGASAIKGVASRFAAAG